LNADDRCLKQLIPDYDSGKLVLFSMCQDNLAVDAHILNGGSALVLDTFKQHEHIVRVAKGSRESIIALNDLPSCYGGIFQQNIANAMAAAALAYGLGISVASIRKGLASFENSLEQSPGRLNLISGYSQTILLDAEASPAAAQPLIKSLLKFETRQPAVCMFYSMGNRADWHFTELCEILGSFFERFVCYETEKTRRGREPNEINKILKTRLMATGISECNISLASGYDEATATLAHLASDGDLVVLLAPNAAELMPIFRKNFSMHKSGKE
jgi:cyanophycin synthetase